VAIVAIVVIVSVIAIGTVTVTVTGTVLERSSRGRDTMTMIVTPILVPNGGSKHFNSTALCVLSWWVVSLTVRIFSLPRWSMGKIEYLFGFVNGISRYQILRALDNFRPFFISRQPDALLNCFTEIQQPDSTRMS